MSDSTTETIIVFRNVDDIDHLLIRFQSFLYLKAAEVI